MKSEDNTSTFNSTITVRDALRLLWEADRYPVLGSHDRIVAEQLEAEAFVKSANAVASPNDPPDFSRWLHTLRIVPLSNVTRDKIMALLYDLFDPDISDGPHDARLLSYDPVLTQLLIVAPRRA